MRSQSMEIILDAVAKEFPCSRIFVTSMTFNDGAGWLITFEEEVPEEINGKMEIVRKALYVGFVPMMGNRPAKLEWYNVIRSTPGAVRPEENIGSCEPSPLIRWDKTGNVWHTDVGKVGRYSVKRPAPRMPYQAYLNNKDLGIMPSSDPEVLKRSVSRRILEARRINAIAE